MMTSSNGNTSHVNGLLSGESTSHRPVRRSFYVFFDMLLDVGDLRRHSVHYDVTLM